VTNRLSSTIIIYLWEDDVNTLPMFSWKVAFDGRILSRASLERCGQHPLVRGCLSPANNFFLNIFYIIEKHKCHWDRPNFFLLKKLETKIKIPLQGSAKITLPWGYSSFLLFILIKWPQCYCTKLHFFFFLHKMLSW